MSIHLTIKNENRPNSRTATPVVVVAGETIRFVVENKSSAEVKNLVELTTVTKLQLKEILF